MTPNHVKHNGRLDRKILIGAYNNLWNLCK